MKKLFLASSFADVAELLPQFESNLSGKTVTFIPTASKVETVVFYVNAGKKALERMGLTVDELDVSTATAAEITAKLRGNDIIYVTGGNTFFLLQELKRTGADQRIADEVNAGKLYIGESAGAMVATANIGYAQGMDDVQQAPGLTGFAALGLVDVYPVPHYTNPPYVQAAQQIVDTYSASLNLAPIRNSEAIWVTGDDVEIRSV